MPYKNILLIDDDSDDTLFFVEALSAVNNKIVCRTTLNPAKTHWGHRTFNPARAGNGTLAGEKQCKGKIHIQANRYGGIQGDVARIIVTPIA